MLEIVGASDERALAALYRKGWSAPDAVRDGVSAIISAVRERGDDALLEYTRRFRRLTRAAGGCPARS
jgi:histidinol dehydrogenase